MLVKLLKIIEEHKITDFSILADSLKTNEKLLKELVSELVQTNYLEPVNYADKKCGSCCNKKTGCYPNEESLNLFRITKKGKDLVDRLLRNA